MSTKEDKRAYVFDLGLVGENAGWREFRGRTPREDGSVLRRMNPCRMRRWLCGTGCWRSAARSEALAIFPPPHQFFYPLDLTTNTKNFWRGAGHQGEKRFGFGVRHDPRGAGNFVPWFNAPPGTQQRLGVFLLLMRRRRERCARRGAALHPRRPVCGTSGHDHLHVALPHGRGDDGDGPEEARDRSRCPSRSS